MAGPALVSLLVMGNDAADLTAYLESVARFADAVVALDAGCSDGTRAILEAHPLVRRVLPASPRSQPTDDLGRLADAARELGARWVIALDADERLAPDDAAVLRRFVADEADVELAYAVRRHRMVDPMHYDDARTVGRLFAPRSGDHFAPDDRDGSRLPTRLAAGRVCNTTIRLQWFDRSAGDAQRGHPWIARSPLLPPVANGPLIDDRPLAADEPALSVVVISQDDESRIGSALDAILAQDIDESFEVIVVNSGTDRTVDIVRTHYPDVVVVAFDRAALPGEARNACWRAARGRFVSFPGSHVEITPGSLAARLATHRCGWPMVAGAMANGTFTCAGWASYLVDNSTVLPGRPSFVFDAAPLRCSYHRDLLEEIGGFPEDRRAGEDTVVNNELFARGYGAFREQRVRIIHRSPCTRPGRMVRHHFARGRGLGVMLAERYCVSHRQIVKYLLRALPNRVRRVHGNVWRWGGPLRRVYARTYPLILLAILAAWVGTAYELATIRMRADLRGWSAWRRS